MKMFSLQEKMNDRPMSTKTKYYPTIHLKESLFPPLKGIKPNKKIRLTVEAKISGINQHNNEPRELTLELVKVGFDSLENSMLKNRLRGKK